MCIKQIIKLIKYLFYNYKEEEEDEEDYYKNVPLHQISCMDVDGKRLSLWEDYVTTKKDLNIKDSPETSPNTSPEKKVIKEIKKPIIPKKVEEIIINNHFDIVKHKTCTLYSKLLYNYCRYDYHCD